MSLPDTIRVKLSSEAAEAISITRVVVQDMATRELIDHMLGLTGKDAARIHDWLLRGTLVSGSSRFRWNGWEADQESIREVLDTFPDPHPLRPFDASRCARVVLQGGRHPIQIPRRAGERKSMLVRRGYWDLLMECAVHSGPQYSEYSYREHADLYQAVLSPADCERLRNEAGLLKYSSLRDQVRSLGFTSADLYVER